MVDQRGDQPRAVILLSGGLDSATVLALARHQGYQVHAMSFLYGQRHAHELDCARALANQFGVVAHRVVTIDLTVFGGSALTGATAVPKDRDVEQGSDIPVTYVPARNTIFLSFGLAWAEVLGARDVFIGVNALDYSGYPDCRPAYLEAYEKMANLATRRAVEGETLTLHAPLLHCSKADIIRQGLALGVDYGQTSSCYDPGPSGEPCGHCDACQLRQRGFSQLGLRDPLIERFSHD
ncbi:MAG: 7-cyano-7-deazaguanine synthase QueC [Betaproteobacteria bacterium]|jgi:preQ(0) biosynthesis protein QueC|nr:7-cyano-7-deazaguanine synthase QueC [Betaproteobacteria bacterium]